MPVKILGVACSPRSGKSTRFALDACLETISNEFDNVETICIDLAKKDIRGCIACGTCNQKLECSQDDDFPKLLPILTDPAVAGLIIATPVYFGSMTAQAKAFLDRCVMLRRNGSLLRDKVGGVIAVGGFRHGGQETTIFAVHAAMLIQDMVLVGDGYNTFHFGGTVWSGHPDGFQNDAFGIDTARNIGRRVASMATRLQPQKGGA